MITHISPASSNFEESRNTLVYADKAKNIRNKVSTLNRICLESLHQPQLKTIDVNN